MRELTVWQIVHIAAWAALAGAWVMPIVAERL